MLARLPHRLTLAATRRASAQAPGLPRDGAADPPPSLPTSPRTAGTVAIRAAHASTSPVRADRAPRGTPSTAERRLRRSGTRDSGATARYHPLATTRPSYHRNPIHYGTYQLGYLNTVEVGLGFATWRPSGTQFGAGCGDAGCGDAGCGGAGLGRGRSGRAWLGGCCAPCRDRSASAVCGGDLWCW
jgi:hypothetical protein